MYRPYTVEEFATERADFMGLKRRIRQFEDIVRIVNIQLLTNESFQELASNCNKKLQELKALEMEVEEHFNRMVAVGHENKTDSGLEDNLDEISDDIVEASYNLNTDVIGVSQTFSEEMRKIFNCSKIVTQTCSVTEIIAMDHPYATESIINDSHNNLKTNENVKALSLNLDENVGKEEGQMMVFETANTKFKKLSIDDKEISVNYNTDKFAVVTDNEVAMNDIENFGCSSASNFGHGNASIKRPVETVKLGLCNVSEQKNFVSEFEAVIENTGSKEEDQEMDIKDL